MPETNGIELPGRNEVNGYEPLCGELGIIFGRAGIGKTTFAASAYEGNVLLLNTEASGSRFADCHVLNVPALKHYSLKDGQREGAESTLETFEGWFKAVLKAWEREKSLKAIVLDTLDSLYHTWGEGIWNRRKHGEYFVGEDRDSYGAGYTYLAKIMTEVVGWMKTSAARCNKFALILAHEKQSDPVMDLPGKAAPRVMKDADILGRAVARGKQRVIDFKPQGAQEVKIRCPWAQARAEDVKQVPLSWDAFHALFTPPEKDDGEEAADGQEVG